MGLRLRKGIDPFHWKYSLLKTAPRETRLVACLVQDSIIFHIHLIFTFMMYSNVTPHDGDEANVRTFLDCSSVEHDWGTFSIRISYLLCMKMNINLFVNR